MASIRVERLTPERLGDYLALFDAAFADHHEWSGCYCLYHHSSEEPWKSGPDAAADHRAARAAQISAGEAEGYLAYLDGHPVGWLNAGPRERYVNLRGLPGGDPGEALLLCFVVAPGARRLRVASALLDFALADLARRGVTAIEAYPALEPDPTRWEADSYTGPLSLFLSRGFALTERGRRKVARRVL